MRSTFPALRPTLGLPRHWQFPPADSWDDESGLRVVACDSGGPGLIAASLLFHRGEALQPAGHIGELDSAMALVAEGAAGLDAGAIGARFERLAANFGISCGWYEVDLAVTALAETAPDAVGLGATILAQPHFEPAAVERARRTWMANMARAMGDPSRLAHAASNVAEHAPSAPWSRRQGGTAATISGLTPERLAAAHAEALQAPATLVVAGAIGDLDVAALVEAVAAVLGPFAPHPALHPTDAPSDAPARILLIDRPGSRQTVIRAGHIENVASGDPVRSNAIRIAGNALAGGPGSRLNAILREDLGVTYGVHGQLSQGRNSAYLSIDTSVEREATAVAVKTILGEVTRASTDGFTEGELAEQRDRRVGSMVLQLQTAGAVSGAIAPLISFGLGLDWPTRAREALIGLTLQQLNEAATLHFHPSRLQIVVVGETDLYRAELEALGLPLETFDPRPWFLGA